MGYIVSKKGNLGGPREGESVPKLPFPNNLTNLRSFLGCAGYYRQYICDCAKIAKPLYRLERKRTIFKWNDDSQEAFEMLKKNQSATGRVRTLFNDNNESNLWCHR